MAAKRIFVFYVGGTGARVMKSMIMLLASGMKLGDFDEIVPLPLDPHKELEEIKDCKSLIKLYSVINKKAFTDQEVKDGFFKTGIVSLTAPTTDKTSTDNIEFDEEHSEAFGDFIDKTGIRKESATTIDLLSLLYSDRNFSQPLKVGFKGNPHMGSVVLNSVIEGKGYKAFQSMFGENDSIFIVSSLFGGTGAAGFPLLLQNFRQSENDSVKSCKIGALSVMPYFKLTNAEQTSDIDSNDFMTKTKSALTYYSRPEFSSLYNSIYYIADPNSQNEYKNDEKKQPNKAHLVELLGALSIFHFAANQSSERGQVFEYSLGEDVKKVNYRNVANSSKDLFAENLTALYLLEKLHGYCKSNHETLAYCKSNEFNTAFFEADFFKDEEEGLEKFFNKYFNPWLEELDNEANPSQRSFSPLNRRAVENFTELVNGYKRKSGPFDGILTRPINIFDLSNKMSTTSGNSKVKMLKEHHRFGQYLYMTWLSTNELISSKFKLKTNGKQE